MFFLVENTIPSVSQILISMEIENRMITLHIVMELYFFSGKDDVCFKKKHLGIGAGGKNLGAGEFTHPRSLLFEEVHGGLLLSLSVLACPDWIMVGWNVFKRSHRSMDFPSRSAEVGSKGTQRNSGPPTFPGDLNLLCFLLPRIVSSSFLRALQQWSCPSIHMSLLQWRHVCLDILNIGMSQH